MKKGRLQRILAGLLTVALAFVSVDSGCITAIAADLQTKPGNGIAMMQGTTGYYDIGHTAGRVDAETNISGSLGLNQNVTIPQKYNSAELGYVTSIKNQGGWGTCWAFSACAAMESYAIKHHNADKDSIDFSEYALTYLTYKEELLREQTGDYTQAEAKDMATLFASGGNDEYAFKILSKGLGIYNEGADTYYAESLSSGVIKEYIPKKENCEYILTGQKYININDADLVKAAVMEYGALVVSYFYDIKYSTADGIYNYNYEKASNNHAVTLVGWDDNISKELFTMADGSKPSEDGAWLVKNSWGTGDNYDGYIWISYEDKGILAGDAVAYEVTPKEDVDNIYQHDGGTPFAACCYGYLFAKVFEITGTDKQMLDAVSFALRSTDSKYTIKIYKTTEEKMFQKGELLSTVSGTTSFEGYYTVALDEPVEVAPGDEITIIIRFEDQEELICGSNKYALMGEYDENGALQYAYSTVYSSSEIGQDYRGLGTENNAYFLDFFESAESSFHNLCIKAFTTNVKEKEVTVTEEIEDQIYTGSEIKPEVVVLADGEPLVEDRDYELSYQNNINAGKAEITVTFLGEYEGLEEKYIEFTILPKSGTNLEVSEIEDREYTGEFQKPEVVIKDGEKVLREETDYTLSYTNHKNVGEASITITYKGNYSGEKVLTFAIAPVDVTEHEDMLFVENFANPIYTGEAIFPEFAIMYQNVILTENVDYKLSTAEGKNNTQVGAAEIVILFIGNYTGERAVQFEILPQPPKDITSEKVDINKENGYISKISAGTTIADFLSYLSEGVTVQVRKDGEVVSQEQLLGTGMTVCVMNHTEVVKEYTVIVTGDTNGDGKISITDMIAIKAHLLKKEVLTGASEKAADVAGAEAGGDGKVSITDFIKIKAHLLKKEVVTGVVAK